ncbi:MAG TPA: hypothetical protein VIJ93_05605 [bacterium]
MSESDSHGGIGFVGLLQVLFIGLKLTGFIDWTWFWVLSPIWISVIIIVLLALIFLVCLNNSKPT